MLQEKHFRVLYISSLRIWHFHFEQYYVNACTTCTTG